MTGTMTDFGALQSLLKADPRLHDVNIDLHAAGLQLERSGARVLVADQARVLAQSAWLHQAISGDLGLCVLGDMPDAARSLLKPGATLVFIDAEPSKDALFLALDGLLERVEMRGSDDQRIRQLQRYRYELGELVDIARAVTQERDIHRLLDVILQKSRYITGADAGSIYVVDDRDGAQRLNFKLSQNDSLEFASSEFSIAVSMQSIAGAAVLQKKPINIADVYALDATVPYAFDRSFDARMGYRTVSMLTMPMISAEDEVIGVIQLINKKRQPQSKLRAPEDFETGVVGFDERSEELLTTLAAQAGIALENALLYQEIRTIFEGFVHASVRAIEQRDPTTSGHSQRVSVLSCALAEKVDRCDDGVYRSATFSARDMQELKYASLLHDFGKIGVREQVLVKAKKLYPFQLASLRARIDFVIRGAENAMLTQKVERMAQGAGASDLRDIDDAYAAQRRTLEDAWTTIEKSNEPTVLKEGDFSRIAELAQMMFVDMQGNMVPLLSPEEAASLRIERGSLAPGELDEIRSHVVHTFNFLATIPWGKSMARVPQIAGAHHERLNGSGYPKGMAAIDIPLGSKIMTIADIYDALTARDRPYKKALAADRAMEILNFEVKDGNLDPELVRIFREAEVWKLV